MYIIEYVAKADGKDAPKVFDELALGSTPEEATDQADMHLAAMTAKYGAQGYRIIDKNGQRVASGPKRFTGG